MPKDKAREIMERLYRLGRNEYDAGRLLQHININTTLKSLKSHFLKEIKKRWVKDEFHICLLDKEGKEHRTLKDWKKKGFNERGKEDWAIVEEVLK